MSLARLFKAGSNGEPQHRVASATPAKEIVATRLNLRDYTAYPALKRRSKFMSTLRVESDARLSTKAMRVESDARLSTKAMRVESGALIKLTHYQDGGSLTYDHYEAASDIFRSTVPC
jgi:hypothetical protein